MGDDKQIRAIVQAARAQGFRVEETRDGWLLFPRDKSMSPVALHKTPSDYRGVRNALSLLRKRGLQGPA